MCDAIFLSQHKNVLVFLDTWIRKIQKFQVALCNHLTTENRCCQDICIHAYFFQDTFILCIDCLMMKMNDLRDELPSISAITKEPILMENIPKKRSFHFENKSTGVDILCTRMPSYVQAANWSKAKKEQLVSARITERNRQLAAHQASTTDNTPQAIQSGPGKQALDPDSGKIQDMWSERLLASVNSPKPVARAPSLIASPTH